MTKNQKNPIIIIITHVLCNLNVCVHPGPAGPRGPTGANGSALGTAYYYHVGGQDIGTETAGVFTQACSVQFPIAAPNNPLLSGVTQSGNYGFFTLVEGTYAIDWSVTTTPGSGTPVIFGLGDVSGTHTIIAGSCFAANYTSSGTSQTATSSIVLVVPVGGVTICLHNETGNGSGVSVSSTAVSGYPNNVATVDASIRFMRLA